MSASEESQLVSISSIGILAGGGDIPRYFMESCHKQGIRTFVVGFEGQTAPETLDGVPHMWSRLGAVGSILKTLKKEGVSDLVMIGKIRRPSLKELKPDLKAAEFFAKEGLNVVGDDGLLRSLRRFLEGEGFQIHGAHKFMPDLLVPSGHIAGPKLSQNAWRDIERGIEVLKAMSPLDIGQAVVVQQGHILGVEAAEGTDALIQRCSSLQRKGAGAVLVKLCKDGQDEDIDLPTIGPETIVNAVDAGFSGIAVHAGHSFLFGLEDASQHAEKGQIFLIGVDPEALNRGEND